MAKSFKEFREDWEHDEWGHNVERSVRSKEKRMKNRRDKKKLKRQERNSHLDTEEQKR